MSTASPTRDLVIGITPLGEPNARLTAAVCRAGGLGVLDLGAGCRWARDALDQADRWITGGFGVRVGAGCELSPADLPDRVDTVVLAWDAPWSVADLAHRYRVLVEVTGPAEALAAAAAGAHGLIARGHEAGGRVGDLSSLVLLQRLLAGDAPDLPIWVNGGVGIHTAAACVIGGATGVVLDTQLSLLAEADLAEQSIGGIRVMDGSETVVLDGHRLLRRRSGLGDPVPVGQDGFLAARFAGSYGDTATAVRAVRGAILAALQEPAADILLGPAAPLAVSLGVRLPVVQGPMTRVSDEPGFAAAIAEHGGLPFIALALSTADQTRSVLQRTRTAVGDRPWGVGVLGFAPEQVRAAQLAAVLDLRPSCAIIAGGRPSQARALEDAGISTFLHVPAPGLLRQFLAAGARKFVFEGAECGGHVGPRSSLALWEAQLGVLQDHLDASGRGDDVQILFAGGIHDARSAAMVAALTGPVAARGVQVGLLMGTAYLFTEEAVASGAILPTFQRQVVAAQATHLLETAPGHATRCAASPFTAEFADRRAAYEASGRPSRDVWHDLEEFNVGRLRVASKGLRRDGSALVDVDEAGQLADGLFMAGQVVVLRSAVTTVADLHTAVSVGAAAFHSERVGFLRTLLGSRPVVTAAPPPLDVAIVGMACVLPGSPDLTGFWQTVLGGVDAVTEVPAHRWDPAIYFGPEPGRQTPSRWGGFLGPVPFDPLRYGIPPAALGSIEPAQLLALEVARRALDDAGYTDGRTDHARTSVVFGTEAGSDLSNAGVLRSVLPAYLGGLPPELDAQLPTLTEDSFPGLLSNVIAGRIANRLDLGGANYTVDAACASSLAAVDVACKELTTGTSDLVLCGAVDLHNGINDFLLFSSVHALSPTGRSRTFDAAADGIALGEGVACVVLKRLADARRDGDRIYAVIAGVGSASDGKALGLTAPRPEGQRRAMERAYANARVSPAQVGLVEAHGTGTVVGDRTELATITTLFDEAGAAAGNCAIGSVKSQIGHTKCAAGLAGVIKATMALHTGVIPPTINLDTPNAGWEAASSPFAFHTRARPWPVEPADRIAGVSAFGFGGTNFHLVLRGHDGAAAGSGHDGWPAELFAFCGRDVAAAHRAVAGVLDLLAANDGAARPWRLRDVARTVARRCDARDVDEPIRIAVVAADLDGLAALLRRVLTGEDAPADGLFQPAEADRQAAAAGPAGGKVALLFPGQGSQRPGMLAELFVAFPDLHRYVRLGPQIADALFPPTAFGADRIAAQDARIRDTRVAQPALGVTGLAVEHLLTRLGVRADMLAGHSYGELVALSAGGAIDAETLLALSARRADAILRAAGVEPGAADAGAGTDAGAMAAVAASAAQVTKALTEHRLDTRVVLANHNGPRQTVISGPTVDIEAAVRALRDTGLGAKRIGVACAFHSPLVAGAATVFAADLAAATVHPPHTQVWANRTAAPYGSRPDEVRDELAAQIGAPVRFVDQIEAMYAAGARVFVEAGPGRVLTRLIADILGERPHRAIACEPRPRQGLRGFLEAVAGLAVAGVPVRIGRLLAGRDAVDLTGAIPPAPAGWTVDGQLVRTRGGVPVTGGLTPAVPIKETIVTRPEIPAVPTARPDPDLLVAEFLQVSRDMVAAQRDVMLAYLGGVPAALPAGRPTPGVVPAPATVAGPVAVAPVAVAPVAVAPVAAAPTSAAAVAPSSEAVGSAVESADVPGTVLQIISARTGYPADMIELDLDLEADLSIDSIKRTEIAGELAVRLGIGGDAGRLADAEIEDLVKARTARAIADWLTRRICGPTTTAPETAPAPAPQVVPIDAAVPAAAPAAVAPGRLLSRLVAAPLAGTGPGTIAPGAVLAATTVAVTGDGPVADAVRDQLTGHGATVVAGDRLADGLIHLWGGSADEAALPDLFAPIKAGLSTPGGTSPRWLIAAHTGDGAEGLPGLFRTLAREYPDVLARSVALDPAGTAAEQAASVVSELCAGDGPPVVVYREHARHVIELVDTPLGGVAAAGAGPAGDGAAEAAAMGLDRDSVVVLIGGGRGITARFAATLAAAARCRIELVGRTAVPAAEPQYVAAAADRGALRAALLADGTTGGPAEIEREVARILAAREVAATCDEIGRTGGVARYHAVDVRDAQAVNQLLKDIHAEYGRIDGVVYAAGVIEDRLVAEKSEESFRRVYGTKVDGARAVLASLDRLQVRPSFVVFYGSIAGALGNRGQSDYAAANDALETLGDRWARTSGARCLTVHWGPWAPTGLHDGMVGADLQREYARRGICLIDPEEGTLSLLRELAWGDPSLSGVVYSASGW
jgi:acyl transferase domain-containing protein/NAD(P)H-dependent flavin oxidoreductase YrpB (nitropropane dioxygenase family)